MHALALADVISPPRSSDFWLISFKTNCPGSGSTT